MARRSILEEDEATEINLSPMIDCIFILLIFFIVTTVFVEETGLQVNKPDLAASVVLDEKDRLALEITPENEILFEGKVISVADVPGLVRTHVQNGETPVVIRAHEKSDHGTFVHVWDAAKQGGAETLSFSTVN